MIQRNFLRLKLSKNIFLNSTNKFFLNRKFLSIETDSIKSETKSSEAEPKSNGIINRFIVTAEVTISKLFPAGFGWQAGK